MERDETAYAYYAAIGEFVVTYAELELELTKLISIKKSEAELSNFSLSITIEPNFDLIKKAKNVDQYIKFHIPNLPENLKFEWNAIFGQILTFTESRNYLVHGTCFARVHFEPMDTFLTKGDGNMKKRQFYINEIIDSTIAMKKIVSRLDRTFCLEFARALGYKKFYLTSVSLGNLNA